MTPEELRAKVEKVAGPHDSWCASSHDEVPVAALPAHYPCDCSRRARVTAILALCREVEEKVRASQGAGLFKDPIPPEARGTDDPTVRGGSRATPSKPILQPSERSRQEDEALEMAADVLEASHALGGSRLYAAKLVRALKGGGR